MDNTKKHILLMDNRYLDISAHVSQLNFCLAFEIREKKILVSKKIQIEEISFVNFMIEKKLKSNFVFANL
jgi:hypothetical protein